MDHAEPLAERLIRVLEDCPADMGKAVVGRGRGAGVAEPVPFHRAVRFDLGIAAAGAHDEFRPAMLGEIDATRVFVRKAASHSGMVICLICLGCLARAMSALPFDRRQYDRPG